MSYKHAIKAIWSQPLVWKSVGAAIRKPGLIVLMYHRIGESVEGFQGLNPDTFYAQMLWIKKNCQVISPPEIVESTNHPSKSRPPVLVTFDDGYRDFYQKAYPVLRELQIPAIVFLPTSLIDEGAVLWTDLLYLAMLRTDELRAPLPWAASKSLSIRTAEERELYLNTCKSYLKNVEDEQRKRYLAQVLDALNISPYRPSIERQMLCWNEIRTTLGLIEYGGHTHTHPIMSKIDAVSLENEIRTCRDRILNETGVAPKYFAYPNGRKEDFNALSQQLLRKYGFDYAFTTVEGLNGPSTQWMEVSRLPTTTKTIADFAWLLSMA